MAGGFAHLCVVAQLFARRRNLELSSETKIALGKYRRFCEVGSVAPDYPYLDITSSAEMKDWADRMHYERTSQPIRAGVRWLREQERLPAAARRRALAWLLGYAAHVGTDLTVHPVVEMCVGPYKDFPTDHRICEMNQDAWIWKRRNLETIDKAEYFDPIMKTTTSTDGGIASPIGDLWEAMLRESYPAKIDAVTPDIHSWHRAYKRVIDGAEEGPGILFSFTRHLLVELGLTYPRNEDVEMRFIEGIGTPLGPKHYDEVFELACENVYTLWQIIDRALSGPDESLTATLNEIPDADLDTGCYLASGEYVFWKAA